MIRTSRCVRDRPTWVPICHHSAQKYCLAFFTGINSVLRLKYTLLVPKRSKLTLKVFEITLVGIATTPRGRA